MAWDKRKRDDCQDELFAENARIERERKQGAIDDAQAMADASGTPEEELEVPRRHMGDGAPPVGPRRASAGVLAW